MSAVALQSFGFGDQLVRVTDRHDSVWFVANDVCGALELSNPREAISKLEEDEKGVITTDTLGGKQQVSIVSESGVYALIFTSRKPIAKDFRKWVTSQVLPAIRQTGRFEVVDTSLETDQPDPFDLVERVRAGLQLVREARIVFGIAAARRAWLLAGLPNVVDDPAEIVNRYLDAKVQSVAKWFAERVDITDIGREGAMRLYVDYAKYCDEGDEQPVTLTAFGRTISAMGIEKVRTRSGTIDYLSVQLKT